MYLQRYSQNLNSIDVQNHNWRDVQLQNYQILRKFLKLNCHAVFCLNILVPGEESFLLFEWETINKVVRRFCVVKNV